VFHAIVAYEHFPIALISRHNVPVRSHLLTLLLWLCLVPCVRADDRVLLFEQKGLRPGLCAALRIQLADAAQVTCESEADGAVLSERITRAAQRVKEENGRVGLLIERDPDPRLVRMYIVAAQEDQAVVAIERIEDRPEPDVDRSLALKVRDAFFVIEQVTERPKTKLAALVAPVATPTSAPPGLAEPHESGPGYGLWLDVGGGLALGGGARGLFAGALGLSRSHGSLRLELGAGARFLAEREVTAPGARVSEVQRGPQLSLRALLERSRVAIGAALEPTLWFTRARGIAANGEQGRALQTLVSLSLALDLRVRLLETAALRFAPALEWLTTRQRYAVDDVVVRDLGRLRVLLPLSLLVSFPVARGAGP
jgi:hypothetical protein